VTIAARAEAGAQGVSRMAGLDGLRAVSIALVLISHSSGLTPPPDSIIAKGKFGVDIFFVLSGFLITWLLLSEENQNGNFNLHAPA
jgi:peptidoglycan/LPS O-acetylase OafA/YrhL